MKPVFRIAQGAKNETPNFDLTVLELNRYLDPEFGEVKRIYWLKGFKAALEAGGHCHLKENELIILVQGSCVAEIDYGKGLQEIEMKTGTVFYMGNHVWHYFKEFSNNAVLLCVASTNYNPDRVDYVSDYEEFKELSL